MMYPRFGQTLDQSEHAGRGDVDDGGSRFRGPRIRGDDVRRTNMQLPLNSVRIAIDKG